MLLVGFTLVSEVRVALLLEPQAPSNPLSLPRPPQAQTQALQLSHQHLLLQYRPQVHFLEITLKGLSTLVASACFRTMTLEAVVILVFVLFDLLFIVYT